MTSADRQGSQHNLTLRVLPQRLAVCCLPANSQVPSWATECAFYAITHAEDELSIVCDYSAAPPGVTHEGPWACLQVEGPLDFALTGILAGLAAALAEARISIFTISTYRTDYILVRAEHLDRAREVLRAAGYVVI